MSTLETLEIFVNIVTVLNDNESGVVALIALLMVTGWRPPRN